MYCDNSARSSSICAALTWVPLDQRILAVAERRIGHAVKLAAVGQRRRRQPHRRAEPPPRHADRQRGKRKMRKRCSEELPSRCGGHRFALTCRRRACQAGCGLTPPPLRAGQTGGVRLFSGRAVSLRLFGAAAAIAAKSGGQEGAESASDEVPSKRPTLGSGERPSLSAQVWPSKLREPCPSECSASSADCVLPPGLSSPEPSDPIGSWPKAAPEPRGAASARRPGRRQGSPENRRICRSAARAQRTGRQSGMRLARPPGGQSAVARRSRYRLSPPRSLRPFWLPERPYPGGVPLPGAAFQHHRSKDARQLERPGAGLLDQPVSGSHAGGSRRRLRQPRRRRRRSASRSGIG